MARQDPGEPYFRVDSDEAAQILERDKDGAVMVDVRRDDEWVAGHVKGAIHIPVDDLLGRIDELPKGKKLLFICAAGVRSGLACELAASVGLPPDDLYNVEDGTPTWIEKNHPTSFGNEP
jgi:rhodanese-related sulfurtransferase